MIYLQLYISFFQIGLFSFGGGYAALPLIQEQVVTMNHWLSMQAFADVVTISQMTPGPIAINAATFVGIQMGGTLGAVIATIGCVTPSVVISLFLAYVYYKYKNLICSWPGDLIYKNDVPALHNDSRHATLPRLLLIH